LKKLEELIILTNIALNFLAINIILRLLAIIFKKLSKLI